MRVLDEPMRPDQYRYIETHAWWMGSFAAASAVYTHLTEYLLRQWVPARPDRDWQLDRAVTGRQKWLTGSAGQARAEGFDIRDAGPTGRFRAPYGDFYADPDDAPPRRQDGSWQAPTREFLARLPRDPDVLLARLRSDSAGRSWSGPFSFAVDALRTCEVPADLRIALYRALHGLPGVRADEGANIDGHECLALVHDDGRTRTELFIDLADGQFAGERDTLRRDSPCGLPAGTVISSTAVATAVVDEIGALPGR